MKMQSKQTKSRAILLSVLVVILCFAVILGATFALFTAKKEYGIGVNTGKIDVEGKLGLTGAWSEGQSGGAVEAGTATENGYQFPQGGEVIVDGAGIQINNMSLGDKAAFNLVVTNKSTVNMKYSVSLTIEEGSDANLLESLKFTVDGEEKLLSGKNSIALLDWTTVSADVQAELPALNFEISLPWSAQDYDLTDNSVSLKVVLEAVQANAYTGNIFAGGQDQETLADAMNAAVNSEDGVVSVGGNLTAEWPTLEQMQQIAETGKPVTIVGAGKSTTTIVATDDEAIYIPANVTVKDVSIEGEVAMDTTASVSDAIINGNVTIAENAAQTISLMSLAALSETEGVVAFDGVTVNGVITAANANLTINKSEINGGISVSGGTLVLTNTVVENENGSALTIAAGTTATVTDTSLTATGDHTVVNNGTLTIGAGAYVDALTHGKGALVNNKGGVFTLDGGTLTRSLAAGTYEPYGANGNSWYVLSNAGTAVLKDGLVTMNDGYSSLIRNLGPDSQTDAVLTITGGVYRGGINNVKNDEMGILTISDGTFENASQAAVLNWDNMTISGGTFTAPIALLSGFYAENSGDGVNIIEGGTFNGTIEGFIVEVGDYTYAEKATYTITGGNFANAVASAYTLEQMKVFLAAGINVYLPRSIAIVGEQEIDLNGCTVTAAGDGIDVNGEENTLVLRDSVGTGSLTGGSGATYNAIWIRNGGKVDIYGGTYSTGVDGAGRGNATIYIGTGNGICNIYGGTFMTEGPDNGFWYVLNVGQTQGAEGYMNVFGGTYVNYNPATGDDNLGGNFVEDGYGVVVSQDGDNTIYTVLPVEGSDVVFDASNSASLDSLVKAGAKNIRIGADMTLDKTIAMTKGDITLDLNGKTVTFDGAGIIDLSNAAQLTVTGNGKMDTLMTSDIGYLFRLDGTSVLTIENGTYICGLTAIQLDGYSTANIKDGTFSALATSQNRYWILNKIDDARDTAVFNVTGGAFVGYDPSNSQTESPYANFLAEGYVCYEEEGTYYVISEEAAIEKGYVITIGANVFAKLADAVNAAPANTETAIGFLVSDTEIEGCGVQFLADRNVVIDFNGNIYNVNNPTVGSAGTETNGFQLLKGSTVVMKNGTIKVGTSNAKILFQKYNTLTLEDMILNMTGTSVQYVISNNCGTTTIKGNTTIIAAAGQAAFDLYYWPTNGYPEGVNVVFEDFSGIVKGRVEYGSDNSASVEENWTDKVVLTIGSDCTGTFDVTLYTCYMKNAEANIQISGGKFTSDFVKKYVADGYTVEESSDGENTIYTVVPVSEEGEAAQA